MYDLRALSSSIEKILKDGNYNIESIGGADESSSEVTSPSGSVSEIPYSFGVSTTVDGTKQLLQTLERSIRPVYVTNLGFRSSESGLLSTIEIKTFYAEAKKFEIGSETLK